MTEGKFEKITKTDNTLYGPRKILLCGFSGKAQEKVMTLFNMAKFPETPVIFITRDMVEMKIAEILDLPDQTGLGKPSEFSRAFIVSGITENELHFLMNVTKQAGMKKALWAMVTQTSESWTVPALLAELTLEHKVMSKKRR